MDDTLFWHVIGAAYRPDPLDQAEALADALGALRWFEVVDFRAKLDDAVAAADTPGLRDAAVVVNGDASEAAFRTFRLGLVAAGKRAYDAALRDPDSLADFLDGDPVDGFGLDAVAVRVYEGKTGLSDFFPRLAGRHPDRPAPRPPVPWTPPPADELERRLPNLSRMYPPAPEDET